MKITVVDTKGLPNKDRARILYLHCRAICVTFKPTKVPGFPLLPQLHFNPAAEGKDPNDRPDFTHCSKCGGEKDSEGWCSNYCMDDE